MSVYQTPNSTRENGVEIREKMVYLPAIVEIGSSSNSNSSIFNLNFFLKFI